jgi:hypothetical protein
MDKKFIVVSPASSVFVGDSFRSEPSLAAVIGTDPFISSFGGESSSSQVFPVSSSRTLASKEGYGCRAISGGGGKASPNEEDRITS